MLINFKFIINIQKTTKKLLIKEKINEQEN